MISSINHMLYIILIIIFLSGNLITDAIIDFHASFEHPNNTWAPAAIAIWNGGGIRASVPIGKTVLSSLLMRIPI